MVKIQNNVFHSQQQIGYEYLTLVIYAEYCTIITAHAHECIK